MTEIEERRAHIIDAAQTFYRAAYLARGTPPTRYEVSHDDYRLLRLTVHPPGSSSCIDGGSVLLCGMSVQPCDRPRNDLYVPEVVTIQVGSEERRMVHGTPQSDDLCETIIRPQASGAWVCPCGKMIYQIVPREQEQGSDEPMILWGLPVVVTDRLEPNMEIMVGHPWVQQDAGASTPLDDIDEGLRCWRCCTNYDSFAAYMAHRRGKHPQE